MIQDTWVWVDFYASASIAEIDAKRQTAEKPESETWVGSTRSLGISTGTRQDTVECGISEKWPD